MYTLICPILFKRALLATLLAVLAAGCATEPTSPAQITQPGSEKSTKPAVINEPAAPSVLIRGKSSAAILTSIVKFRTQKGMKVVQRDKQRVTFSMPVPKSSPPAEARMIFSIAPARDGLQLSAQVFQVVREKGKTPVTRDVTSSLTEKLEAELAMYAQ